MHICTQPLSHLRLLQAPHTPPGPAHAVPSAALLALFSLSDEDLGKRFLQIPAWLQALCEVSLVSAGSPQDLKQNFTPALALVKCSVIIC